MSSGRSSAATSSTVETRWTGRVDLADRAVDLGMAGVADQDDRPPARGVAAALDMDLGDERARRVDHRQARARAASSTMSRRDAVRAEHRQRAVGHLVEFLDEDRALGLQLVDDMRVVDDLVADIDRAAVRRERAVDDLDRADDAGAKAARLGENQSHPLPFVHDAGRATENAALRQPRGATRRLDRTIVWLSRTAREMLRDASFIARSASRAAIGGAKGDSRAASLRLCRRRRRRGAAPARRATPRRSSAISTPRCWRRCRAPRARRSPRGRRS